MSGIGQGEGRPSFGGSAWVERTEDLDTPDGLYLVTSRGSLHVFDLRAEAYLRVPGERSNSFPHDASVLRLTAPVERCRIGDSFFIWVDQPTEYAVWDYWRQSSPISAMYRVLRPDPERDLERALGSGIQRSVAPEAPIGYGEAAPPRDSVTDPHRRLETPGPSSGPAKFDPAPVDQRLLDEILPGVHVTLDGLWTVVTSPTDWTVDDGPAAVEGPPVLEWPLRQFDDWDTLLAVYGMRDRPGLRLRLDTRHGTGWGPRSTCGVRSIRLQVGVAPSRPAPGPSSTDSGHGHEREDDGARRRP